MIEHALRIVNGYRLLAFTCNYGHSGAGKVKLLFIGLMSRTLGIS